MAMLFLLGCSCCMQERLCAQIVTEDDDHIFIGNQSLEFGFQKWDGRLVSVKDPVTSTEFIKSTTNVWWSPFYFMYQTNNQKQYVGGWISKSFQYSFQTNANVATLKLLWVGFQNGDVDLDVRVGISVTVRSNSPLSEWSMAITNQTPVAIEEVQFPSINGVGQISLNADDDFLAYPSMSGLLFQNPLHNFTINNGWGWEQYYPSAYGNMQFMACYGTNPAAGLYLASSDTEANSKFLSAARPDTNWLTLSIIHRPAIVSSPGWVMSMSTVVGSFSGDWYDAARIYRNWALQQPWASKGPLCSRNDLPAWLTQIGLRQWVFTYPFEYQCNFFSTVPDVLADSASTLGSPVMAGWIGWERLGWYRAYPDVFPPKEGWLSFSNTIATAHAAGNFVSFIPDTTSYSSLAGDWDLAQGAACRDRDGTLLDPILYSEYSAPVGSNVTCALYKMCPATTLWQDKLRSMLTTLATNGADMIYLDGFPVFGPQPCMATNHSHPAGGGHWWFDAYQNIFQQTKTTLRAANPRLAFGSEGMAETYLPLLDVQFDPTTTGLSPASMVSDVLDASKVQLIPIWHAVYHDYGLLESCITYYNRDAPSGAVGYGDYRDFYIRGFALALIWGELPCTWYADEKMSLVNEPAEQEMVAYLHRIVQARMTYASPYLVWGKMLRPLSLDVPTFRIAGANPIPYTMAEYPPFDEKTVLGSAWKAPSGKVGYIFCNISTNTQSFQLSLSSSQAELPASAVCSIFENRNGTATNRANLVCLPFDLPVQINPLDVLLIEVDGDSVGDGIPDSWRYQYFGSGTTTNSSSCASCDPDGDGLTNLLEFHAGTDPTNSASALRITAIVPVGADMRVYFTSVSGKYYCLERCDFMGGVWTNIVDNIPGTDGIQQATDIGGASRVAGFYRVRLSQLSGQPQEDSDGDGVPDSWTQQYFGHPTGQASDHSRATDDPDGDGLFNLPEYLVGTDPTNSASAFRITDVAPEGDDVRVTWTMGNDKTNALQAAAGEGGYYTNNFADIFTVTNTVGSVTNYLDAGAATNTPSRYYRIRLVP
ncbi:MAG: DUF6259 domain-containing protein [Verrucomicrobiia bacterium]